MDKTEITETDLRVLDWLTVYGEEMFLNFDAISQDSGLGRSDVGSSCRKMRKLGLVEFARGLMDDNGMVAGSGYAVTKSGRKVLDEAVKRAMERERYVR